MGISTGQWPHSGARDFYCNRTYVKTYRHSFPDVHKFLKLLKNDLKLNEELHQNVDKFIGKHCTGKCSARIDWVKTRLSVYEKKPTILEQASDNFLPVKEYKEEYDWPISKENKKKWHLQATLNGIKGVRWPPKEKGLWKVKNQWETGMIENKHMDDSNADS